MNARVLPINEFFEFRERIYLSGPMSGHPDFNRPVFYRVADMFIRAGRQLHYNPASADQRLSYSELMWQSVHALRECQHIVVMPGWMISRGASFEITAAEMFNIKISFIISPRWPNVESQADIRISDCQYHRYDDSMDRMIRVMVPQV